MALALSCQWRFSCDAVVTPFAVSVRGNHVRLLVLGTSSTSGWGLADTNRAWPWLAEAELPDLLGEPVEMEHVRVFPTGPKAVPMAMAAVERFQPDTVVFSFGAYPCAVRTVSEKIRQTLGPRAYGWFRRAEKRFDRVLGSSAQKPRRVNTWLRWVGRHTIGAAPMASFEEVTGIQSEILQGLSKLEHALVIVYAEPYITKWASQGDPSANFVLDRDRELIHSIARKHHFLIAECKQEYLTAPDPDALFLSDALHKSELGHRIQADCLYRTLACEPSPYAERMVAAAGAKG